MWTDDQQKQHFIAVTVSFVDDEDKGTEAHDLVVAKSSSSMKSAAVNIRNAMYRAMAEMGFTHEEFDTMEWIANMGANIKKALADLSR